MILSRDDILKRDDMPTREVPVPEWGDGEAVRVRALSANGRLEFGLASQKAANGGVGPNPTALLIALCAIDDNGARLFQIQDCDALAELRGDVIDRIATVVMDLSGLGGTDAETDEKVVEAEGNSDASPRGDSPSSSPETSAAQ